MADDDYIEGNPRKGDVLFRTDSTIWHMDAILDYRPGNDYTYRQGYRRAGRLLVEYVAENGREQDFLVFPICHAYRHFVELTLKALIPLASALAERELSDRESKLQTGSHNLNDLWKVFKTISREAKKTSGVDLPPKEDIDGIEDYIAQLHAVDEGSYAFRYPLSKTGEVTLEGVTRINLGRFCEHIEKLCNYLDGYEMYYQETIRQRDEMLNAYGPLPDYGDY